jgi:hypothetical protein
VTKACLTCNHVKFIQSPDWAPRYEGEKFGFRDVLEIIREKKLHEKARCTFNPVWADVNTAHYCGHWEGTNHASAEDVIWGSWEVRRNRQLVDEVATLKAQLKNMRRVSASRLVRLRQEKK